MGFISRLKAWFSGAAAPAPAPAPRARQFIKDPASGVMIETDDPDQAAIIGMVIRTGKPVTATRGEDGKLSIKTLNPK